VAKPYQMKAVHQRLIVSRYPVSSDVLAQELECSISTIGRVISDMKMTWDAPIEYDRKQNGYFYDNKNGEMFEMPGLWFNESELYALLVSQKLLLEVQSGLFESYIQPLLSKIEKILNNSHHHPERIAEKVKILHQAHRPTNQKIFQKLTTGLLEQKQINIDFYNRAANSTDNRNISPLRLVYYRDNWYLDAWCHKKEAFRTFSVINVKNTHILDIASVTFPTEELNNYYASAFGIFSGKADKIAILHFSSYRARWVADENWHPEQKSKWLQDGRYELQIPYSDHRELIMDILKYGADVTVVSPPELVERVKKEIEKNRNNYN